MVISTQVQRERASFQKKQCLPLAFRFSQLTAANLLRHMWCSDFLAGVDGEYCPGCTASQGAPQVPQALLAGPFPRHSCPLPTPSCAPLASSQTLGKTPGASSYHPAPGKGRPALQGQGPPAGPSCLGLSCKEFVAFVSWLVLRDFPVSSSSGKATDFSI